MPDKDKEIIRLKQKLEQVEKQAQEYLNGWKRAKADYLNKEREIEKQKTEWIKFANTELIMYLLPILDSFDHSTESLPKNLKNNEWVKGVLKIKNQLESFLKSHGVKKINTIGEKFNPEFHEAVEKSPSAKPARPAGGPARPAGGPARPAGGAVEDKKEDQENIIVKEVQAGYTMHGKVIRPARVIIK